MKKLIILSSLFISTLGFSEKAKIKVDKDLAVENSKSDEGFALSHLRDSSALYKAGARDGDKVLKIGNKTINSVGAFAESSSVITSPTKPVKILISRDGEEMTLTVSPKK
ncbi:MAG: hypothetical protein H7318_19030 [Oligoflexus sp.]|nr:hypothetical protein [Oligoflexus sp.]